MRISKVNNNNNLDHFLFAFTLQGPKQYFKMHPCCAEDI